MISVSSALHLVMLIGVMVDLVALILAIVSILGVAVWWSSDKVIWVGALLIVPFVWLLIWFIVFLIRRSRTAQIG